MSFAGIYAHCGNSYGAASVAEVERVRDSSRDMMLELKTRSDPMTENGKYKFVQARSSRVALPSLGGWFHPFMLPSN